MGFYITGDTHIEWDALCTMYKLEEYYFPVSSLLSKKDYIIICGDSGLVWDNSKDERYWRNWLNKRNFTTLFIDGNHDCFPKLNKYPVQIWNGGKVHKINNSVFHLMRGQVFNIDGVKIFTFGGAKSVDNIYTHYKEELPSEEELQEGISNLEKNNWEVDYVISHCCDTTTLKKVSESCGFSENYETDILNDYFDEIDKKLKYKHWFFGHYHIDVKNIVPNKTVLYESVRNIKNIK